MKKSFGVAVLALVFMFSSITAFGDEVDTTKEQLGNVQESIDDKKEKIETINQEQDTVEAQISSLDEKMNVTGAELSSLNGDISSLDKEIKSLNSSIKESEEKLKEQKELMSSRINALYRSGNTSYLSIILESNSISELIERAVFMQRIIQYDKDLVESIQKESKDITDKKAEVEEKKSKLVTSKQQVDSKYSELKSQSSEKNALVSQLQSDKSKYEKQIAQEEADARALQEKIKKLQTTQTKYTPVTTKSVSITGRRYTISSAYGWRMHPILGVKKFHSGIDIAVPMGTPVYSLREGVVIFSGVMSGYGNVIMVNHGDIISLYAHNSSLAVKEGQTVSSGQLISYSGSSGLSSGPHLHFEIRNVSGGTIDPTGYYK